MAAEEAEHRVDDRAEVSLPGLQFRDSQLDAAGVVSVVVHRLGEEQREDVDDPETKGT